MRPFFSSGASKDHSRCSRDSVVAKRELTYQGKFLWKMALKITFVFFMISFLFLTGDRVFATYPGMKPHISLNDSRHQLFSPNLHVISYRHYFDANNCTTAILSGSGFTPSVGFTVLTASLYTVATSPYDGYASVSPARVSISFQGNFDAKVGICYPERFGHVNSLPALNLYAVDDSSEKKALSDSSPLSFHVQSPPSISVRSTNVKLFGGCVTVKVFGSGFIPSNFSMNSASLVAQTITPDSDSYPVAPSTVRVMVKGNIAITALVCDLSLHQVFNLFMVDDSTQMRSNTITMQVI